VVTFVVEQLWVCGGRMQKNGIKKKEKNRDLSTSFARCQRIEKFSSILRTNLEDIGGYIFGKIAAEKE
jgi:hypothetical protein